MTYPDYLIHGEFDDETVAKLVASPEGDEFRLAWKMHDGLIQTSWKDTSESGANGNARLEYTFQFPIIFEKLMIVKPPNILKLR